MQLYLRSEKPFYVRFSALGFSIRGESISAPAKLNNQGSHVKDQTNDLRMSETEKKGRAELEKDKGYSQFLT